MVVDVKDKGQTQLTRTRFAVSRRRFPDRRQIFPALLSREFPWQGIEFPSENQRRLGYLKPEIGKFPVFSRGTGNPPGGDRFADDCLHRQIYLISFIFLSL